MSEQSVTIYGASDDLVEIDGDLREEFSADECWLVFGDGTIVDVRYGETGLWHLRVLQQGTGKTTWYPSLSDEGRRGKGIPNFEDIPNYSEVVTLTGDLRWVLVAEGVELHRIGPEPERHA